MNDDELLRLAEVQKVLRIGRSKLYEMIARGDLPVVRIGRAVRIPRWSGGSRSGPRAASHSGRREVGVHEGR